jgi:hypothetical protein
MKKIVAVTGLLFLAVSVNAMAAVLHESGSPDYKGDRCDAENCGGTMEWTIMDDFTANDTWTITGFTFRSWDVTSLNNAGIEDYLSTTWSIWGEDPLISGPIMSGASVAQVNALGSDEYEFVIDGLNLSLDAGTYYLGHHHDFSSELFFKTMLVSAPTPGGYYQTDGGDNFFSVTGDVSHQIRGSAVPIPAAVWLFGSALAGLGWMRRRKTV